MQTRPNNDELCRLCREGKVFEVDDWFKAGNRPPEKPPHWKKWPMGIAIENRNHSMVEVLLRNGIPADEKAVLKAVEHRRLDILELMVKYGANLKTVPMRQVVEAGNPDVVQLFFNHGADLFKDYPFYRGLVFETKIWLSFYKKYEPQYPELKAQLDMALRRAVEKKSQRMISLFLWAGADPRHEVVIPDEKYEIEASAIREAAYGDDVEIIKLLKPDPKVDDVNELLRCSIIGCNIDVAKYWISLGADINYKVDGKPTLHREVMNSVGWRIDPSRSFDNHQMREWNATSFLREWFSMGAKWVPDNRDEKYSFHQCLDKMEPNRFVEFLHLLTEKNVMTPKELNRLMTPKLKQKFDSPLLTHRQYASNLTPSKIPYIFRNESVRWYRPYSKS